MSEAGTSAPAGDVGMPYYARNTSGLVKEIGFWSNVAISLAFMAIPFFVISATTVPAVFAGANPLVSSVIAAALCLLPATLFAYFLVVMPRTGGDYVFVSRSIHPWVGFASNFSFAVWILLGAGYVGDLVASYGLSSAFESIGVSTNNHTLIRWAGEVTSKNWGFAMGALTLVLSGLLMSLKTRAMLRAMKAILLVSLFSIVASDLLMLIHGRGDFKSSVTRFGGNYQKVISDAHTAGFTGGSHFSFTASLVAMSVTAVAFLYPFLGVYGGGELRSARTSGKQAIYGALAVSVVLVLPLLALAQHTFGVDFLGSATSLSNSGSKHYPFAAPAFFFFFVSMLTKQTWLIILINLSFVVSLIALGPPSFFMVSRSVFAWAFDRIVPTKLSSVDKRTGAPILANALLVVVGVIILGVSVYNSSNLLSLVFTAILGQLISFCILGIAGIVFPYRRRDMYDNSPIRRSAFGVPVMSIVAVLTTVFWIALTWWYGTRSLLGANTHLGWETIIIIFAIGLLIYPVSMIVNKSRGVDLGATFRMLPPD